MNEKVLNMTQIKVTAFYISLELKIWSIFQKKSIRQSEGTSRSRSYKKIQGHSWD